MRLLLLVGILAAAYCGVYLKAADMVIGQTKSLQATYQYVADNSEAIALGEAGE
jgi:hypothetical protein